MANAAALKTATPHAPSGQHAAEAGSLPAFAWAMLTHPGRVRHANQDACGAAPEHAAFVVCDGVGGAAGGEIASQLAADSFLNALRQSAPSIAGNGNQLNATSSPHHRLQQAVLAANAAVFQRAQRTRSLRGMATTLVAALLEYPDAGGSSKLDLSGCPTLWLAHAGDSRAYRLHAGELAQLTRDHSLVEEQVRAGILNPEDALRSPVRNVITRAVGSMLTVEPEIGSHAIEPGDLYLLASDGLTRELNDAEIARILTETLDRDSPRDRSPAALEAAARALSRLPQASRSALESAAHALIDAANGHGGRDNITVLLLACR